MQKSFLQNAIRMLYMSICLYITCFVPSILMCMVFYFFYRRNLKIPLRKMSQDVQSISSKVMSYKDRVAFMTTFTFTRQNDYQFFKSQNGCRLYIGMVVFFSIGLILIFDGLI